MATRIRLTRGGTKKRPDYRIIVVDAKSPRDGNCIDIVGHYHPMAKEGSVVVNEGKSLDWLSKGAQPSQTVRQIFRQTGLLAKFHALKGKVTPIDKG